MLGVKKLIQRIDQERVKAAIVAAEQRTSGEIRVSVSRFFWGDVRAVAEKAFTRLGMTETEARNGVLFFVVPARRRFVVLGDRGIHEKVGAEFWERVSASVAAKFRSGDFSGGLVAGIETVGAELGRHFPRDRTADANELPDEVDHGDA